MSAQRASSAVPADRHSVHPGIPGVPWWAAVLIAVVTTGFGIFLDSSTKELGTAFAALFVFGCVLAVLAVRQSGIFTAVIQPPMILFVAVPGAYFLFHGAKFADLKDTLISCVYPLIERFPLMLFTAAGVLLIGMTRWYFASAIRPVPAASGKEESEEKQSIASRFAGLGAAFVAPFGRKAADSPDGGEKRQHAVRPATAERRPRSGRPAKRPAPTRSRHARPPVEDLTEPPPARRPRRPRDQGSRTPPVSRREPPLSREGYGRAPNRERRFEPYEREPREREPDEPYPPPQRDRYQPYEPPPRRRPESRGSGSSTHHPVSRVRYRAERGDDSGRHPDREDWV